MVAAVSIGDITTTYRLIDELTPSLRVAMKEVDTFSARAESGSTSVSKSFGGLGGVFQKTGGLATAAISGIVGGLTGGLMVGALDNIGQMATKFFKTSGEVVDMADKLDVSTAAVQKWKFAVEQTGGSMTALQSSFNFLNKALGSGKDGVIGALAQLGLSLKDVIALSPEQRFELIADKIGQLEDPLKQATVGAALMGRGFATNLAAMEAGFKTLGDEAQAAGVIMGDSTVRSAEGLGDALGKLADIGLSLIGAVLTPFLPLLQAAADLILALIDPVSKLITLALKPLGIALEWVGKGVSGVIQFFRDLVGSSDATAASVQKAGEASKTSASKVDLLPPAAKSAADAMAEFDKANKANEDRIRKNIAAYEQYQSSVRDLADTLTGKKLKEEVKLITDAVERAGKQGGLTAFQMRELGQRLIDLRNQGATLPPVLEAIRIKESQIEFSGKVAAISQKDLADKIKDLAPSVDLVLPKLQQLQDQFRDKINTSSRDAISALTDLGTTITELPAPPVDPWISWKQIGSDAIASLSSGLASALTAMLTGAQSFREGFASIWTSIKDMFSSIVEQMVQRFINGFIQKALDALAGSQNSFLSILGSFLGGTPGGGLRLPFGGGAGAGASVPSGSGAAAGSASGFAPWMDAAGSIGLTLGIMDLFLPGDTGVLDAIFGPHYMDAVASYEANLAEAQRMAEYLGMSWEQFVSSGMADWLGQDPRLQMADGGIVTKPTRALIGEAGPEAIIPLRRLASMGGGATYVTIDAKGAFFQTRQSLQELARMIVPHLPDSATLYVSR